MSVEVKLTQDLRVRLPVLRADLVLLRRKGVRKLQMDWNTLAKGFDRLLCEACFRSWGGFVTQSSAFG